MKGEYMLLECNRCGNIWDYKGKQTYYATCSKCKSSVRLRPKIENPRPINPEVQSQPTYQPQPPPQYTYYPLPPPYAPINNPKPIETSSTDEEKESSEKKQKKEEEMVICSGCYRSIRIGSKFCRECGYKYVCPNCGEGLIGYEYKPFCVECGEKLDREEEEEEKKSFWSPEHEEIVAEWLKRKLNL